MNESLVIIYLLCSMKSTDRWKKSVESRSKRMVRRRSDQLKSKKRKFLSDLFKENLLSNAMTGEAQPCARARARASAIEKCQSIVEHEDTDRDSLQLDDLFRLSSMKHILFLDLDNFSRFFEHLPSILPLLTYVIAFQGPFIHWQPPTKSRNTFLSSYLASHLSLFA